MPNITPSQNRPILPNMRRIETRPSGPSCSRRNSAKSSLATIDPPVLPDGIGDTWQTTSGLLSRPDADGRGPAAQLPRALLLQGDGQAGRIRSLAAADLPQHGVRDDQRRPEFAGQAL